MILDRIVAKKRSRVEEKKKILSLDKIKEKAEVLNLSNEGNVFLEALSKDGLSVIGEFKKASPSKGIILEDFKVESILDFYEELNIEAFSILTEEDFFLGADKNIKKVKELSDKPILRKDFIIDFYQIYEAKILGVTGILLIVSVLGDKLKSFYDECKKFNLQPLVEIHNEEELEIALDCNCEIIGINNRNLKTFDTSLEITKKLINQIPKNKIIVSESGISSIEDLRIAKECGANAVLIGEMFMRNLGDKNFVHEFKRFKDEG